jgi:hypothetical protein
MGIPFQAFWNEQSGLVGESLVSEGRWLLEAN